MIKSVKNYKLKGIILKDAPEISNVNSVPLTQLDNNYVIAGKKFLDGKAPDICANITYSRSHRRNKTFRFLLQFYSSGQVLHYATLTLKQERKLRGS